MSLVILDDFVAKRKSPTSVTETMTLKNNYFIVKQNNLFHYFRITIKPYNEDDPILRFDKHPPVLREGIVVIEKKCYKVTLPDLMRGVIRKSRELEKVKNGTKSITTTAVGTSKLGGTPTESVSSEQSTVQYSEQPTVGEEVKLQVLEQADLCWDEQVESLLHSIHSKEGGEWEIQNSVQPGPNNEVSAVQNTQGNS